MQKTFTHFTVLLLRLSAAVVLFCAGAVKLFGWFGGMPEGVPMTPLIVVAGILEVIGGIFLATGLWTRITAFIISGEMACAYFIGHFSMGMLPIQNHGEAAFLLCFICLFLFSFGGGKFSLDRLFKKKVVTVEAGA